MYRHQTFRVQAILSRDAIHRGLVLLVAALAASIFVPGAAAASLTVTGIGNGLHPDVVVGVDGHALIASRDGDNLEITRCADVACTIGYTQVWLNAGPSPEDPAIAIGSDGHGIIAYSAGGKLNTVHCTNTHCTSPAYVTHWNSGQQARAPVSITIDGTGLAVISYVDIEAGTLKLARCVDVACTDVSVRTVGSIGQTFYAAPSAVTTGADGRPLVAYKQLTGNYTQLKVFHCLEASCRSGSTSLLASPVSPNNGLDIATGADGLGLVVYGAASAKATTTWKAAHCSNAQCSAATTSIVETFSPGMGMGSPSIAMRENGFPVIAYGHGAGPQIRVSYCFDVECTTSFEWPVFVSSTLDDHSQGAALAIDADDRPLLVFQHLPPPGSFRVLIAHCNLPSCG